MAQTEQRRRGRGVPPLPHLFLAFMAALLLPSCQTAPPLMPERNGEAFIPLEPGGLAYIFVDVGQARPLLEALSFRGMDASDRHVQRILDSTDFAIAAVYMEQGSEPARARFRLAAQGSYPSGRARMAMRCSRHWSGRRSQASGGRFWHSAAAMISVAMSRGEARVSSSLCAEPADPFYSGPGTRIPGGFEEFRGGAAIAGWLEDPRPRINGILAQMGLRIEIPAEQFFAGISRHAPGAGEGGDAPRYVGRIQIQVANPLLARNLSIALFVARGLIASAAGAGDSAAEALASILLANPATATGRYLQIRTDPMAAEEITQLFGRFSP